MLDSDRLSELAGLRSSVPDPRLQPDPAVLRGMVATLRGVCEQAKGFGIPDDFLRTMVGGVVDCFSRLDGLGREDPFWDGTNLRPTRRNMADFCRMVDRAEVAVSRFRVGHLPPKRDNINGLVYPS